MKIENKTTATITVITFQQQNNGYNDCNHQQQQNNGYNDCNHQQQNNGYNDCNHISTTKQRLQ